ncbi:hypothetical protein HUN03_00776 [Mycoplasmopsis anatis]|uniref:Uncharacterized protein n=1 Tax=Mycoplasmopsis anatis TaxID=171279 RepID=A0A9Q3L6J5_9BACT|nr:hypothetical protein [Mycoplasmopsis anatis]MBW0594977.1 hypothetical protein [Mycoplasmopsis anatis]MBW0595040.1 hypothetical protein [Mycoplasmopsis anatis]MBW0595740.1 hypothetical protein [Mycoplasmopsis anatis]MBW0596610.1 hypothetical protein [Mycoplasmopsis anatis]MBW0597337.1 hypothetical protein [Mycoplasmopsis anatis]
MNKFWYLSYKKFDNLCKSCVKKRKKKSRLKVQLTQGNKYVFPIAMREKNIDKREKWGHLEIDLVIGEKWKDIIIY